MKTSHENIYILFINKNPSSGGLVTLKTGRREVPGSNPAGAYRSSCSGFLQNLSKYWLGSLRKDPPRRARPL